MLKACGTAKDKIVQPFVLEEARLLHCLSCASKPKVKIVTLDGKQSTRNKFDISFVARIDQQGLLLLQSSLPTFEVTRQMNHMKGQNVHTPRQLQDAPQHFLAPSASPNKMPMCFVCGCNEICKIEQDRSIA